MRFNFFAEQSYSLIVFVTNPLTSPSLLRCFLLMGHVIIYTQILGFLSLKNDIIHKCVFAFRLKLMF